MEHQQHVGIDLHRRRSVIVRMTGEGEVLEVVRIVNDPVALSLELAKVGPDPRWRWKPTYGWYWAANLLEADGAQVHLAHPLGLHWYARRVKNDERDATELAHRLRRGDLPESWIAPPEVRELRELIRYRARLAALRTSAKAQIHAVMAKLGILPPMSDIRASWPASLSSPNWPGGRSNPNTWPRSRRACSRWRRRDILRPYPSPASPGP